MSVLVIYKFDEDSIKDFMSVLIICKSDEDSIKNEIAIVRITFSEVYEALKSG